MKQEGAAEFANDTANLLTAKLCTKKVPDAIIRRKGRTNASMLHALICYTLYVDVSMVKRPADQHNHIKLNAD
jgi:hypothetical protein